MSRLVWSKGAQADLVRAYHFLAAHDRQLAKRALKVIHDSAALLERQPKGQLAMKLSDLFIARARFGITKA